MHSDQPCTLPVGARVRVVPNHACAAANLHTEMLVVDDDAVVDVWPIAARRWSTDSHAGERVGTVAAQT